MPAMLPGIAIAARGAAALAAVHPASPGTADRGGPAGRARTGARTATRRRGQRRGLGLGLGLGRGGMKGGGVKNDGFVAAACPGRHRQPRAGRLSRSARTIAISDHRHPACARSASRT